MKLRQKKTLDLYTLIKHHCISSSTPDLVNSCTSTEIHFESKNILVKEVLCLMLERRNTSSYKKKFIIYWRRETTLKATINQKQIRRGKVGTQ